MGSNLSCVECINRGHEEDAVVPLNSYRAQYEENQMLGKLSEAPSGADEALQAKLDAIRKEKQVPPSATNADSELSEKINAIVKSHVRKAPDSLDIALQHRIKAINTAKAEKRAQPAGQSSAVDLQDQINAIVGSHAKSLKHQRVLESDPTALASPSPAKSFSDMDIASYANLALSGAKERATPGASPSALPVHWEGYEHQASPVAWPTYECDFSPCHLDYNAIETDADVVVPNFMPYEEDIAPCQLSFAEEEPQKVAVPAVSVEAETCIVQPKEQTKVEPRPFDINDIPSPTRNRAKREQWATVNMEAEADKVTEPKEPEQNAAELEEARLLQEKKAKHAAEEFEDRLRMDKVCVDTFLESVNACAWRERVRTPIKGSNLYVKHIRPCRPIGTSVDVKDSTFMNLGNFMRFLENEGLLRLKVGVSDPVVNEIYFKACSSYTYVPQGVPMQFAPHEAGCSCRKCTPAMACCQ